MRFVINQKLLSIAGKYFIKDELGNDAFVVKGNFSLPQKIPRVRHAEQRNRTH